MVAIAILLGMPEAWSRLTPFDIWAADQIGVGLLLALLGASLWTHGRRMLAAVAIVPGAGRAGCTAMWPDASDASGSICDQQLGVPLTLALLCLALLALERMRR